MTEGKPILETLRDRARESLELAVLGMRTADVLSESGQDLVATTTVAAASTTRLESTVALAACGILEALEGIGTQLAGARLVVVSKETAELVFPLGTGAAQATPRGAGQR